MRAQSSFRWRRAAATALIASIGVAAAATSFLTGGGNGGDTTTAASAADLQHLHGAGRNPGDGLVYVAAHTGLYRRDVDGTFQRVADRYQDTMGFFVVGADDFVASGHPDLRENLPAHLGLIRSPDAGQTWRSVSLSGRADLHAIVAAHDRIYAADARSGELLVSRDDGKNWTRRGQAEFAALAVDPTNPDRLVGASYDGALMISVDGGGRWERLDGPTTTSLAWHRKIGLLAVTAVGAVSRWNGDDHWVDAGEAGAGTVLAVDGPAVLAVSGGGTVRSTTDGETWRTLEAR